MNSPDRSAQRARLLYVITVATCGGAQTHLLELLRASAPEFAVALATGKDGMLAESARGMGIPVFIIPDLVVPLAPAHDAPALASLVRIIRAFRPDLVHAHSSKAGMLARAAARICGVESIFTVHGWAFADGVPWLRRSIAVGCERAALPCSDAIITVSEYDRRLALWRGLVPRGGLHCIHNGIADDQNRARPGSDEIPTICMVARFCAQKDHLTLVRALAGVRQKFRLLLIGNGRNLERVRAEVLRAGITHCTHFLGERADVPELLAKSHIFALASNYEGLPISIIEAMRAGLPVVATAVGGVGELVYHRLSGLLSERGDAEEMRANCEALLADRELRAQMGAAARRMYEQHFTAARMLDETFALYDSVLGQEELVPAAPPVEVATVA